MNEMNYWEHQDLLTELQIGIRDFVLRHNPNVFVTLTFDCEGGVSYDDAKKAFGSFAQSLKGHHFGRNSKKRFFVLPVVEHSGIEFDGSASKKQAGTHIHFVGKLPGDPLEFNEVLRRHWRKSSPIAGDPYVHCPDRVKWCQPLTSYEARVAATQYSIKSCKHNTQSILLDFIPQFTT